MRMFIKIRHEYRCGHFRGTIVMAFNLNIHEPMAREIQVKQFKDTQFGIQKCSDLFNNFHSNIITPHMTLMTDCEN